MRPSPHADIPDRRELQTLWKAILQRPEIRDLAVPRHHRGAVYWHGIDSGMTVKDALDLALAPEASAVEYEIVEV